MKRILVLNLGSTSFKCKLYDMADKETLLCTAGVECIGAAGTYTVHTNGHEEKGACACATHMDALSLCMEVLSRLGMNLSLASLFAIGYKAVHGGTLCGAQIVDDALLMQMEHMSKWAPAHNPVYIAMIRSMRTQHPTVKQIACFETSFHSTIPKERTVYGVPYAWVEEFGLRRYGFHGSSHQFIAWKMRTEHSHARRVISAHLGGSSSLCAMLDGRSIATSMGATPQSGVFHNNRVGDLDVFSLPPLVDKLGSLEAVLYALASQSGFLGLSGVSNDLRDIEQAAHAGNARAALSISAFVDNVVGYIGMFTAYLGGLDALVFTGGMGLKAKTLRQLIVKKLSFVGAMLDSAKNHANEPGCISTSTSQIAIYAFETNEELMVARSCVQCLQKP